MFLIYIFRFNSKDMMSLNIQISFIYGWGSLRNIKVFIDGILYTKILAQGAHVLEIPENTKEVTFKLGIIAPYKTTIVFTEEDRLNKNVFIGLHLHHRSLFLSFVDSLKTDYLRSVKLTNEDYFTFHKSIYQQEYIVLKDNKATVLSILISLLILIFSIVQQENELSPIAFLIGLSSTITFLVYFNDLRIEKRTYKARMISTMLGFVLAVLCLENSFMFLHWIILVFTGLLFLFYKENINNSKNYNLTEEA